MPKLCYYAASLGVDALVFLHGPWYEGIGMVVYMSFAYALAQYR